MKKGEFRFIFGVTLLAAVIWIAVELLMIKFNFPGHFFLIWRITVVVVTCSITVWHGFKAEDEEKVKRQEKYNRKKSK